MRLIKIKINENNKIDVGVIDVVYTNQEDKIIIELNLLIYQELMEK